MSGLSGRGWHEPFATYDPGGCCWRTWRRSLPLANLPEPSVIWPASGMTRSGRAYARPTSGPRTGGNAASSLLPTPTSRDHKGQNQRGDDSCLTGALLPTPRTSDTNGAGTHGDGGMDLRTVASLLPTPTVGDSKAARNNTANRSDPDSAHHSGTTLTDAMTLLPTPSAVNPNDGEDLGNWQARRDREQAKGRNGNGFGTPLAVAARLLPTPSVADGMGGHLTRSGDRSDELLLPGLAQALSTGEPTDRPSADGNTSPDDTRPRQLSLDEQPPPNDSTPDSWSG